MSWLGERGEQGYSMTKEEILSSMAKISLAGKMNYVTNQYSEYPCIIPYYAFSLQNPMEEMMLPKVILFFQVRCENPMETFLSVLLKNQKDKYCSKSFI